MGSGESCFPKNRRLDGEMPSEYVSSSHASINASGPLPFQVVPTARKNPNANANSQMGRHRCKSHKHHKNEATDPLPIVKKHDKDQLQPTPNLGSSTRPEGPPDWSKLAGIPEIQMDEIEFYDGYLGKGATAAVRKASYQRTDVAVKIFYDIMPDSDFIQEVIIAGALRHQNVALVLGYIRSPERCIVTQFFEKGNLYDILKGNRDWWSPHMLLKLAKDIARGLIYIHDKGLIHRDIKSENVLISSLSPDESVVSAVITDFGISRPASPLMTLQVGTRLYMAPELRQGILLTAGTYTNKVDVYSYALVLWEMWMAEKRNFDFERDIYEMDDTGSRPLIPASCPAPFADLIRDCWSNLPSDRPSFAQILDRLNTFDEFMKKKDLSSTELTSRLFASADTITSEHFVTTLLNGTPLNRDEALYFELVLNTNGVITEKVWRSFLEWLKPSEEQALDIGGTILSVLGEILATQVVGFHGFLAAVEVSKRMEGATTGSYIIRFSSSSPRGFAIALRHAAGTPVLHYKIDPWNDGYKMFGKAYASFLEILKIHATEGIQTQDGGVSPPLIFPIPKQRPNS